MITTTANDCASAGREPAEALNDALRVEDSHPSARAKSISTDSHAQRARLLSALEAGPVSTLMARRELAILHPAARVQELRERGFKIVTNTRVESDSMGVAHKVAQYALMAGGAA